MTNARRPSLWHRLLKGRRSTVSGPDFGDMGTAFGLEAITHVSGEWRLAEPVIQQTAEASVSTFAHHKPAHTSTTIEPS